MINRATQQDSPQGSSEKRDQNKLNARNRRGQCPSKAQIKWILAKAEKRRNPPWQVNISGGFDLEFQILYIKVQHYLHISFW